MVVARGKTLFMSDTAVQEQPEPKQLAQMAAQTAALARRMGHTPRVALLSHSTFGNPMREKSEPIRQAVTELDAMNVDFEYDGELAADVALNKDLMSLYPFCRLSDPANVLIMPALHTAHVASKMLKELSDGVTIGPILTGFSKPAQIVQMNASVSEILNLSALAALDAIVSNEDKVVPVKPKKKKA